MLMNGRQSSLLYAKLRSPAFYFPNVFEVGQHIGTEIHVVGLLFDAGGYLCIADLLWKFLKELNSACCKCDQ